MGNKETVLYNSSPVIRIAQQSPEVIFRDFFFAFSPVLGKESVFCQRLTPRLTP